MLTVFKLVAVTDTLTHWEAWIRSHGGKFARYVGGKFVTAASDSPREVKDPVTGARLALVDLASAADVGLPVLLVTRFRTSKEAVSLVNCVQGRTGVCLWTENLACAL
ncbi:hypothetical protein IscW_ISCW011846 [Ixodes scapularis]|uniref:Uncharacterized protein n=1 Tax=Ixodes scapularis TaxID=6945 RepID=B7Q4Y6_IXOSC|nr:hypothetical protein IscW_ISCW011846 [Ixodes scapularis]|eukprot:XP_002411645.1 hypothetical protein IscW_ISCW011846 [Ixodes scapularis]